MVPYAPPVFRPRIGQISPSVAPAVPAFAPVPGPDPLYTGYEGLPGFIETLAVLAATGAAAWLGVRTGLKSTDATMQAAGWVAGIGSGLLGLLYLGGKTGIGQAIGLPAVRVTPS